MERNSIAMVMPVCQHPVNKNGVIVYDLSVEPDQFIKSDIDEIAGSIFTPANELPENVSRIPLKTVHVNKCPVIVPLKTMDDETAERLSINVSQNQHHRDALLKHIDSLEQKTRQVFNQQDFPAVTDPDAQLYSGGFFSNSDYNRMQRIQQSTPEELARLELNFDDDRIPEMLFRYRARNFPLSLTAEEHARWEEFRFQRLTEPDDGASICMEEFHALIEQLLASDQLSSDQRKLMQQLLEYGDSLLC